MKKCAPRRIVKSFRDVRYMVLLVLMVSVFSSCKKDVILEAAHAEKGQPSPLTKISYASFLDQVPPQRLGDLAKTLSVGSADKKNLPISFYGEEAGQLIIETDNPIEDAAGRYRMLCVQYQTSEPKKCHIPEPDHPAGRERDQGVLDYVLPGQGMDRCLEEKDRYQI